MKKWKGALIGGLRRTLPSREHLFAFSSLPSRQSSVLLSLPPDLLIEHILARLDPKSLARCRLLCRQLDSVVSGSLLLIYTMELYREGMLDNPKSSYTLYPLNIRLEMLKDRSNRWKLLKAKWSQNVSTPSLGDSHTFSLDFSSCRDILILPRRKEESDPPVCVAYICRLREVPIEALKWDEIIFDEHILAIQMAIEEHDLLICATS